MSALLAAVTPTTSARGRAAGGDASALPVEGPRGASARAPGATLDREALVRAMVSTLPRARARNALRAVRRWLRVVLGAAEVHELAFVHVVQADHDALFNPCEDALNGAAIAMLYGAEADLVTVLVVALLGETPVSYARLYGMCGPDDDRRDALRALRIVGRVSRELRATIGGAR